MHQGCKYTCNSSVLESEKSQIAMVWLNWPIKRCLVTALWTSTWDIFFLIGCNALWLKWFRPISKNGGLTGGKYKTLLSRQHMAGFCCYMHYVGGLHPGACTRPDPIFIGTHNKPPSHITASHTGLPPNLDSSYLCGFCTCRYEAPTDLTTGMPTYFCHGKNIPILPILANVRNPI